MPLWLVYHTAESFVDDEARAGLSRDVTRFYEERIGLPSFYVVVNFIKLQGNQMWVGGESRAEKPFVRVVVNHLAVQVPNAIKDEVYRDTTASFEQILKPHVAEKGYDWEIHGYESDRRLWRINGLIPPAHRSAGEQLWAKENRAIPYNS